jgi:CheY-like chemotaxis protein
MSLSFTDDEFIRIDGSARRLEEQAGSQERQIEILLSTAEANVQLSLSALARPREPTLACVDRLGVALRAQLRRCEESVKTARQLCAAARENRLAMKRLVADLHHGLSKSVAPPHLSTRHAVLVVDAYEDCRQILSTLLQGAGFIVRTASNGVEAIIAAYEMKPTVIIMDVTMPVLDGVEATRLIKAIDALRDARVIAYTATVAPDALLVNKQFAAVLQKPASLDVVVATVRQCANA